MRGRLQRAFEVRFEELSHFFQGGSEGKTDPAESIIPYFKSSNKQICFINMISFIDVKILLKYQW